MNIGPYQVYKRGHRYRIGYPKKGLWSRFKWWKKWDWSFQSNKVFESDFYKDALEAKKEANQQYQEEQRLKRLRSAYNSGKWEVVI